MHRMTTRFRALHLICGASVLMASLVVPGRGAPPPEGNENAPKLRLSLPRAGSRDLGTKDVGKILRDGQLLVSYLENETGAKIEMTVPKDYASVVQAIANNQVDIAYFGGLEFVQVSARAGAKALVQRVQDQDWHTVFITQSQLPINRLEDLNGHTFALSEPTSVSGRVMPEYWMREAKMDTKIIESALHTGGHEATALAVASKKADAGALDRDVYREMLRDGKITDEQVRLFWSPPPFANPVWAGRKDLNPRLRESFVNAFLKLDVNNPHHKKILDFLSATKYVRADDSKYDILRRAAKTDGLLK